MCKLGRNEFGHASPLVEISSMKRSAPQLAAVLWLIGIVGVMLLAPAIAPEGALRPQGAALQPPSGSHPLGTDHLGRDLLARIAFGGRLSLSASGMATLIMVIAGGAAGLAAAMLGGLLDRLISWLGNVVLSIPGLLLAMLLVAAMGPGFSAVILAVGLGGAPGFARLTRSISKGLLEQGYIAASEALGGGLTWIARRHILPNAMPQLLSLAATHFAWAFLGTTTLTFLGLAGDPSTPEWGAMLNASRPYLLEAPWGALWPALAISLTILAVHALSDWGGAQPGRSTRKG